MTLRFLLLLTTAYLAGSINISIGLFRLLGKKDPRDAFSGNPGVTNVYRLAGPAWALGVLLLEMGKAVFIALLAHRLLSPGVVPWIGSGLIIGNRFPCFHRFSGGKGVANFLGFAAPLAPLAAGIGMLLWLAAFTLSRQPFIGSFALIAALGIGMAAACGIGILPLSGTLVTVALIVHAHKKNIAGIRASAG